MSTNKIVFAHLRRISMFGDKSHFGGITLAMQEDGNDINVGIAVCHDDDRYVKAEGRNRAEGRLHSKALKNAKFRARLTNVAISEVYQAFEGKYSTPYLEEALPEMLRKAGAQL